MTSFNLIILCGRLWPLFKMFLMTPGVTFRDNSVNLPSDDPQKKQMTSKTVNGAWSEREDSEAYSEAGIERIYFKFAGTCRVETACSWFRSDHSRQMFSVLVWKYINMFAMFFFMMFYGIFQQDICQVKIATMLLKGKKKSSMILTEPS